MLRNTHPFQQDDPRTWAKEQYGMDLSDDDVKGLEDYLRAVQEDMPVRYFETKFNRPIYLDEFESAIVPDNTPQEVINALEQQGLDVATYKAGDDADRMRMVREQASDDVRFSVGDEEKNDLRSIDDRSQEELAKIGDYILSDNYVAELTGEEFPKGETKLREVVANYYKENYGGQVARDGFGTVLLDMKGVKSSLQHGIGREKAIAFAAVPDVIKNGWLVDVQPNWRGGPLTSYIFAAPIEIGDEGYVCMVVVRRGDLRTRFYLHEVTLQPKNPHDGSFTTAYERGHSHHGDIAKILQKIINAKEEIDNLRKNNGQEQETRFSVGEESKTLVGVHNISEEKLRKGIRLGGSVNPSIAVYDTAKNYKHTGHGEISFIVPSEMLEGEDTFVGDAWTPYFPDVERRMSEKGEKQLHEDLDKVPDEMRQYVEHDMERWVYDDEQGRNYLAYLYLISKHGIYIPIVRHYAWRDLIEPSETAKSAMSYVKSHHLVRDMEKWTERYDIKDYIEETGELATKENLSAAMNKEASSNPSIQSATYKKLNTRDEIRKNRDRMEDSYAGNLVSSDMAGQLEYYAVREIARALSHGREDDIGVSSEAYELLKKVAGKEDPVKELREKYGLTLERADSAALRGYSDYVRNELVAPYFETKINRPVSWNEFAAMVAPDDLADDIREYFEGQGVPIVYYEHGNSADRQRAMEEAIQQEGVRFSIDEDKNLANDIDNKASDLSKELGIDIDTTERGRNDRDKYVIDPQTGKISIVLGNHNSVEDVERSVLTSMVHVHSLRDLFGDRYDTFLDNVYENSSPSVREEIVQLANANNMDFRRATQQYLADVAMEDLTLTTKRI